MLVLVVYTGGSIILSAISIKKYPFLRPRVIKANSARCTNPITPRSKENRYLIEDWWSRTGNLQQGAHLHPQRVISRGRSLMMDEGRLGDWFLAFDFLGCFGTRPLPRRQEVEEGTTPDPVTGRCTHRRTSPGNSKASGVLVCSSATAR